MQSEASSAGERRGAIGRKSLTIKRQNVIVLVCIAYVLLLGLLVPLALTGVNPSLPFLIWLVAFPVFIFVANKTCRVRYLLTGSADGRTALEIRKWILGVPTGHRTLDLARYERIRCSDFDPSEERLDVGTGLIAVLFGGLIGMAYRDAKHGPARPTRLAVELVANVPETKSVWITLAKPSQPSKLARMIAAFSGLAVEDVRM
jgi:hypothetical protein